MGKFLLFVSGFTLFSVMLYFGISWMNQQGAPSGGVMKRPAGAARVAPIEPSGQVSEYQGLAINKVQEDGTVAALPSSVTLAPSGYGLNAEDLALAAEAQEIGESGSAVQSAESLAIAVLGHYASEAAARDAWQEIMQKDSALEAADSRITEVPTEHGQVRYRLALHGFDSLGSAQLFCEKLQEKDMSCVAVEESK